MLKLVDMDMVPFLAQLFLLQCVVQSQKKFVKTEQLKPQEKFAILNMTRLLTPPSLSTVRRPSPPSVNKSAARPDTALLLLELIPRLLLPESLLPQK